MPFTARPIMAGSNVTKGLSQGRPSSQGPAPLRLPGMKIRQSFPSQKIADLPDAIRRELAAMDLRLKPGARIAVGIGSRGIANLALLTRELIAFLKAKGAQPFVVPAMGSHGGA